MFIKYLNFISSFIFMSCHYTQFPGQLGILNCDTASYTVTTAGSLSSYM